MFNDLDTIGICVFKVPGSIPESVVTSCAENFSCYYGQWSDPAKGRVKMNGKFLRESYLFDATCGLVVAFVGNLSNIVGHALFKRFESNGMNCVWITQLVVNAAFRSRKVAQSMLASVFGTTTQLAGLVSSHPHAVFALERAMFKSCNVGLIRDLASETLQDSGVPYLQNKELNLEGDSCIVNTQFDIDHTEPMAALSGLPLGSWQLGDLPEGWEFICVVVRY